jgi:hypothetical protein
VKSYEWRLYSARCRSAACSSGEVTWVTGMAITFLTLDPFQEKCMFRRFLIVVLKRE